MLRKILMAIAATTVAASAIVPAVAEARHYDNDGYYQQVRHDRYDGRGYDGGYRSDRGDRGDRGYYRGDRGYGRGGYDGGHRYYGGGRCRDKGTGGTIIGAIAGGLLGNEIGNGRYDNRDGTGGAIVGAGLGALAGRAIDRNC